MSASLVALVALIYGGIAVTQLKAGSYPDFIIWTGYVIANIGFIWKYLQ